MKSKKLRAMLQKALLKVEQGSLSEGDARSLIGLANQINISLGTEIKVATMKMRLGHHIDTLGELELGEEESLA